MTQNEQSFLTEEAVKRAMNTVKNTIEDQFDLKVSEPYYQDLAFDPGHIHTVDWHAEMQVLHSADDIDWMAVYEIIKSVYVRYNGNHYQVKVASSTDGEEGHLRIKIDQ